MTLPQRLSFSARLSNCNVATRWQVELSKLSRLQLSFNIHSSNGFSCPIKFFHLKIAIGLAFGRILAGACAATEKHLCPVSIPFPFPCEGFPWQTCKNHLRRNHGCCPEKTLSFSAQLTAMLTMLEYVDTCCHFEFNLLHLSLGQWLYVMSGGAGLKEWPAQLTHWTNLGTNLYKKGNYPIQGPSA